MPVPAPSTEELERLVQRIAEHSLERSGLITGDIENAYLAFDPSEEAPLHGPLGLFDHLPDRNRAQRGPEGVHAWFA